MSSFDRAHMTSYRKSKAFNSNHEPISYRLRDKRRFRSKFANFSPRVFCAPTEGIPLEIGYRRRDQKTRVMGLPGGERIKFDDIFSRVDRIHQHDRRTDRHQATAKTALTHSVAR